MLKLVKKNPADLQKRQAVPTGNSKSNNIKLVKKPKLQEKKVQIPKEVLVRDTILTIYLPGITSNCYKVMRFTEEQIENFVNLTPHQVRGKWNGWSNWQRLNWHFTQLAEGHPFDWEQNEV